MEKYDLYKTQIELIDTFINDLTNKKSTLERPGDVFYYRFFKGQLLKEEVADLLPNKNVSSVHSLLDSIWKGSITSTGINYGGHFLPVSNVISELKYVKGLIQNEITNHNQMCSELDKNTFLDDLIQACKMMQANRTYIGKDSKGNDIEENIRNDYLRDMLEFKGYVAKDQTRQGFSKSGKDAGELDILIRCNTKVQSQIVIEGMNLTSIEKDIVKDHFEKIFEYDTNGNNYNVLLSYVSASDFSSFCLKYKRFFDDYGGKHVCGSVAVERIKGTSEMYLLKTTHNIGTKNNELYHLLVHLR